MGTRGLTCAKINGEYKVAQYGQWDHYPTGQGTTILEFLKKPGNLELLAEKIVKCSFLTDQQIDALGNGDWLKSHPQLSRDVGGEIFQAIVESEDGLELINKIEFAGDSLFCEWAYVVDFDEGTFEVYKGFNERSLKDGERFKYLEKEGDYSPVALAKKFNLKKLPSIKAFVNTFKEDEDE